MRTALLAEESELRQKGYSKRVPPSRIRKLKEFLRRQIGLSPLDYQPELKKLCDSFIRDPKMQMDTMAEWFVENRIKKRTREREKAEDERLKVNIDDENFKGCCDEIIKGLSGKMSAGSARGVMSNKKPSGLGEVLKEFIGKTRVGAAVIKFVGRIYSKLRPAEKVELRTAYVYQMHEGGVNTVSAEKRGKRDEKVEGMALDAPMEQTVESQDRAVPVFISASVLTKDGTYRTIDIPEEQDIKEELADRQEEVFTEKTPEVIREEDALKEKKKGAPIIYGTGAGLVARMVVISDDGKHAGGAEQAIQAVSAAGISGTGSGGDIVIAFTGRAGAVSWDEQKKCAENLARYVASERAKQPWRTQPDVNVFIIGDKTNTLFQGGEVNDKTMRGTLTRFACTPGEAGRYVKAYKKDIALSPRIRQKGFADSIASKFTGDFGITELYGIKVLYKKTSAGSGDDKKDFWDVVSVPGTLRTEDEKIAATLALLARNGGVSDLQNYLQERLDGKAKSKDMDMSSMAGGDKRLQQMLKKMKQQQEDKPEPAKEALLGDPLVRLLMGLRTAFRVTLLSKFRLFGK
ncbi:MAG: hypothetical protein HQL28_05805 [Candidatus Omnitrophica bacterium]|nr:hypothetical protein [Candidatus Omnitrophota bacterium]